MSERCFGILISGRGSNTVSLVEAALRGAEESTLAQLESYFEQQDFAGEMEAPIFSRSQTLSAAKSNAGADQWIDNWLTREEDWRAFLGEETYRLLAELEADELDRLAEMLRTEISAG